MFAFLNELRESTCALLVSGVIQNVKGKQIKFSPVQIYCFVYSLQYRIYFIIFLFSLICIVFVKVLISKKRVVKAKFVLFLFKKKSIYHILGN